jgi:hypothetical protein
MEQDNPTNQEIESTKKEIQDLWRMLPKDTQEWFKKISSQKEETEDDEEQEAESENYSE